MQKTDFKKTLDSYNARHNIFRIIDVTPLQYIMVDGHGDPNTGQDFTDAVTLLYPLAYALKFASKRTLDRDYTVMPLEGLWWADNMSTFTTSRDKSQWDFTLMIMQPNWITAEMFAEAVQRVSKKHPELDTPRVRLETLDEGKSVQTLHIGSYDDETNILQEMHQDFIPANNLVMHKKHHEIYLSDARCVAPEKLRTILRQPVLTKR